MKDFTTPEAYLEARRENAEAAIAEAVKGVAGTDRLERALLSYQQRAVLLSESGCNVLVIEKSRRIGMTWGLAAEAVLRASRSRKARGSDWLYISYSQDMTREFIDACAMWARLFQIAASSADEFIFKDEKEGEDTRSIQAFRISFASGFEIVGLSSAPRSLRGKQGVVMIDEAAFVDSFPELMKAALALLMWGGQVIVCSTHNGTDNPFNQIITDILAGRLGYEHMRVDFDQALEQGLYKRICQVTGKPWTPEAQTAWRDKIVADYGSAADEELFCIPTQGSGAWLSSELIQRQMTEDAASLILRWQWPKDYLLWTPERQQRHMDERLAELDVLLANLDPQHRHALGFDFARVADLSVVDVRAINHVLHKGTGLILEMRGVPHEEQARIVEHIWKKLPNRKGAAFDGTGAGHYVAEYMSRRYGLYDQKEDRGGMIAEVKLSVDWYRQHMPKYKASFEDGNTSLPRDSEIEGDLRIVKLVRGVAQIPDVRTGAKGLKRHGDYAIAGAMSNYACNMNASEISYETLAGQGDEGDRFMRGGSDADHEDNGWREPLGHELRGGI